MCKLWFMEDGGTNELLSNQFSKLRNYIGTLESLSSYLHFNCLRTSPQLSWTFSCFLPASLARSTTPHRAHSTVMSPISLPASRMTIFVVFVTAQIRDHKPVRILDFWWSHFPFTGSLVRQALTLSLKIPAHNVASFWWCVSTIITQLFRRSYCSQISDLWSLRSHIIYVLYRYAFSDHIRCQILDHIVVNSSLTSQSIPWSQPSQFLDHIVLVVSVSWNRRASDHIAVSLSKVWSDPFVYCDRDFDT